MSVDARIAGNIYSLPGQIVSFTAGEDITKGRAVYISAAMTVKMSTTVVSKSIGVAVTSALSGKQVSVLMGCPIVYMAGGAGVAAGTHVTTYLTYVVTADVVDQAVNENGTATYTFKASYIVGIALEATTNDGDIIRVAVMQQIVCLTP